MWLFRLPRCHLLSRMGVTKQLQEAPSSELDPLLLGHMPQDPWLISQEYISAFTSAFLIASAGSTSIGLEFTHLTYTDYFQMYITVITICLQVLYQCSSVLFAFYLN